LLDSATAALDNGLDNAAVAQINAFLQMVAGLSNQVLTPEDSAALTEAANAVVAQIEGGG